MAALPVELLFGVYLGLLTGVVPALVSGILGFVFKYFTGVTLPGLGVVVLAVAVAGVNGGLLGLLDPTISNSPRLLVALVVVMMLALYAHSEGDKLGATLPRRLSFRSLGRRTLSTDVVDIVGEFRRVTVQPTGGIDDVEGYPPLPAELRERIAAESWTFPADLPLGELERRLEERLRTTFDLAAVTASIDTGGAATITAAPPTAGLSRRVPDGHRAVSIDALVPSGVARGEHVTVSTDEMTVEGTVLSARTDPTAAAPVGSVLSPTDGEPMTDGGTDTETEPPRPTAAPTTTGGEGRITLAVPTDRASDLLGTDRGRVIVQPRGTNREFELVSLLRRAGRRFRTVTVGAGGPLDGTTVGDARLRSSYGVAVLGVRHAGSTEEATGRFAALRRTMRRGKPARGWQIAPAPEMTLSAGDELFVVGSQTALDALREDAS